MAINTQKLRAAIKSHIVVQRQHQLPTDPVAELSFYATWLYCQMSAARKTLHMKQWNKRHPDRWDLKTQEVQYRWLKQFGTDFAALDDQDAFIRQGREFLRWKKEIAQKHNPMSPLASLELDFERTPEEQKRWECDNLAKLQAKYLRLGETAKAAEIAALLAARAA